MPLVWRVPYPKVLPVFHSHTTSTDTQVDMDIIALSGDINFIQHSSGGVVTSCDALDCSNVVTSLGVNNTNSHPPLFPDGLGDKPPGPKEPAANRRNPSSAPTRVNSQNTVVTKRTTLGRLRSRTPPDYTSDAHIKRPHRLSTDIHRYM